MKSEQSNIENQGSLRISEVTPEGIIATIEYKQRRYNILLTESETANLLNELIPAFIKLAWDPLPEH